MSSVTLKDAGPPSRRHSAITRSWWVLGTICAAGGLAAAIGLGAFIWICLRLVRAALAIHRRASEAYLQDLSVAFLGVFAVVAVCAFVIPMWEFRPISLYFWLYAGILLKHGAGPGASAPD